MVKANLSISANSYPLLLSSHNLALLNDWLAEVNELLVEIDLPHSGGTHTSYFIKSLRELRQILAELTWPEIELTVYRERQYPIRGVVDEPFITRALETIGDGQRYAIVKLETYPTPCEWLDNGETHEQLREQLRCLTGESVGIGTEPLETIDRKAQDSHQKIFVLRVSKNQNYYEPYAKSPENYAHVAQEWSSNE